MYAVAWTGGSWVITCSHSCHSPYCEGGLLRARILHCTGLLSIPVLEPRSAPKVRLCPLTSPFLRGLRKMNLLTGAEKAPEGQAHDLGAQTHTPGVRQTHC